MTASEADKALPWPVRALLALTDGKGRLLSHSETPWGSVTFSGTRHRMMVAFAGDQAVPIGEAWLASLGGLGEGMDLHRDGELIADVAVLWSERTTWSTPRLTAHLEVLTVLAEKAAA